MPGPVYQSIVDFAGDGVTEQFEFNFAGGYISRDHVKAKQTDVNGGEVLIALTSGMWVNDFTIDLGVATPIGSTLRIYRDTPRDVVLVDFAGGARITEANLDLVARQAMLVAAEAYDRGEYLNIDTLLAQVGAATTLAQASATSADADAASADASATAAAASAASASNRLAIAANLSDLANVVTARSNLGLGSAALRAALGAGSLYGRDSIVGTVSQLAGVPTGAIVQVITNANGTAIRWADGTQIAHRTVASGATNAAQGPIFKSATVVAAWAAAFVGTPTGGLSTTASAIAVCWPGQCAPTNVNFSADAFSVVNNASCTLQAVAIGRWY